MKDVSIISTFETDALAHGSMYILPDGRMLDLTFCGGHAEFCALVGSTPQELRALGWIRLNTKIKYVELPSKPTEKQSERLRSVFETFGEDFQIKRLS